MNLFQSITELLSSASSEAVSRSRGGKSYWEEQGWRRSNDYLEGYYRTKFGSFKGTIKLSPSKRHQYFIHNPPHELKNHPHWACFVHRGSGIYWVHFDIEPDCVDTGVITIEKIIREAKFNYQVGRVS